MPSSPRAPGTAGRARASAAAPSAAARSGKGRMRKDLRVRGSRLHDAVADRVPELAIVLLLRLAHLVARHDDHQLVGDIDGEGRRGGGPVAEALRLAVEADAEHLGRVRAELLRQL